MDSILNYVVENIKALPIIAPFLFLLAWAINDNRIKIKQNCKDDNDFKGNVEKEIEVINEKIRLDRQERKEEKRKIYEHIEGVESNFHEVDKAITEVATIVKRELGN